MDNPAYRESEAVMLRIHQMVRDGVEETAEADEVRERSADLWDELSPNEQHRIRRLSAELAMLYEQEVPRSKSKLSPELERTNKGRRAKKREGKTHRNDLQRQHVRSLYEAGKFDETLECLRDNLGLFKPEILATIRAQCYLGLSQLDTAEVFLDYAEAHRFDISRAGFLRVVIWVARKNTERAFAAAVRLLQRPDADPFAGLTSLTLALQQLPADPARWAALDAELQTLIADPRWGGSQRKGALGAAYALRADFADAAGKPDEMARMLEQSYALSPTSGIAFQLGVRLLMSNPARALELLRVAEADVNLSHAAHAAILLSNAAYKAGHHSKVKAYADKWLARPIGAMGRAWLLNSRVGALLKMHRDPITLVSDMEQAVRLSTGEPGHDILLGNLSALRQLIEKSQIERERFGDRLQSIPELNRRPFQSFATSGTTASRFSSVFSIV